MKSAKNEENDQRYVEQREDDVFDINEEEWEWDNGTNMVDALRKNNEKNDKDVEGEGEHVENEELE